MNSARARASLLTSLVLLAATAVAACSSPHPRREPLGEPFPTVRGESLAEEPVELPSALAGAPAVLLIGYAQNAQFDLDRWILGLAQAGTPVAILELPTIPGLVPGMIAGSIDDGMRSGIPSEDWPDVVTLYGADAKRIARWTGTERKLNGRVVLIDGEGVVAWFHDRGYSAGKVLELDARARELARARTDG